MNCAARCASARAVLASTISPVVPRSSRCTMARGMTLSASPVFERRSPSISGDSGEKPGSRCRVGSACTTVPRSQKPGLGWHSSPAGLLMASTSSSSKTTASGKEAPEGLAARGFGFSPLSGLAACFSFAARFFCAFRLAALLRPELPVGVNGPAAAEAAAAVDSAAAAASPSDAPSLRCCAFRRERFDILRVRVHKVSRIPIPPVHVGPM